MTDLEPFFLHPKNRLLVAGQRRSPVLTRGYGCIFLLGLLFLAAGMLFVGFTLEEWRNYARLRSRDAVTVQGTVTDLDRHRGSRSESYELVYEYPVRRSTGTVTLTGRDSIGGKMYETVSRGTAVTVRYDGRKPEISRAEGSREGSLWWLLLMTFFVLAWMMIPLAMVIGSVFVLRRWRRLIRQGRLLPGQVDKVQSGSSAGQLKLHFRFADPEGETRTGQVPLAKRKPGEDTPEPGRPVYVWYESSENFELL